MSSKALRWIGVGSESRWKGGCFPAHSFGTLLDHLGTLIRSDVRVDGAGKQPSFQRLSEPTPIQRKAFELIETTVPLRVL